MALDMCLCVTERSSVHSDMIDQLGGWTAQSSGEKYGDGFDLHSIVRVLERME